jgi:hypothetical protein
MASKNSDHIFDLNFFRAFLVYREKKRKTMSYDHGLVNYSSYDATQIEAKALLR